MKNKGSVHLYIGNGKGKTTAALGLLLRATGAGKRGCLIQFLKARASSEIAVLKKLRIKTVLFGEKHPLFYKSSSIELLKKKIQRDLKKTLAIVMDRGYEIIILDEILRLPEEGLAEKDDVKRIIRSKPAATELVLTGGSTGRDMIRLADYVNNIKKIKHPYKEGLKPRLGIEY
ncbi:MAG: cob(I)yrinic acid a,c-diamide adenosyltransferase [Candidatus Omnitrophica bacterium]|nr:cob(I)yrinic acid a,c-diamide adenosyltransferase [Candidatus Omnitrophota bacterium]